MHAAVVFQKIRAEAESIAQREPLLAAHMQSCVLRHGDLASCMGTILAKKIADEAIASHELISLFQSVFSEAPDIAEFMAHDLDAVYLRDAATSSYVAIVVNQKGFQAIQLHRIAHRLWRQGRKELAAYVQSRSSELFGVDIHPACRIGKGVMFDHATGIVVGETCVIEDNVSVMQSVTLGGTGKEVGDRHPKIRRGVLIGAGAKILGNIEIGEGAKVGAGSVVLTAVEPHRTVAGVPAKVVGVPRSSVPSETMDHNVLEDKSLP